MDGKRVVMLEIPAAMGKPTSFSGMEYTRVGSYKKPLKDFPEHERAMWREFDKVPFEDSAAAEGLTSAEVLDLIDYPAYFTLLSLPLPSDQAAIILALEQDSMVRRSASGSWEITNLGAILLAVNAG